MPLDLTGANQAAKDSGTQAALDDVAKAKLRVRADLDGRIEGSVNTTTKGGWTFTAYVKALVKGPSRGVGAGFEVDKDLGGK